MALLSGKSKDYVPSQKLNDAISEYMEILNDDDKKKFRDFSGTSPPSEDDVIRLTAEIDRDFQKHHRSNRCVGVRLTTVLQTIQKYSIVVDHFVGGSQSPIASAV
ncbi:hypothetical protein MMC14_010379 [Varicellaria rhodocarpa]|nr:hypothetical protein [Varicellaria rhodocarpa]